MNFIFRALLALLFIVSVTTPLMASAPHPQRILSFEDPYDILGIEKGATEAEIKAARKKLVRLYHPDLHQGDPNFGEAMAKINDATDYLIGKKASFNGVTRAQEAAFAEFMRNMERMNANIERMAEDVLDVDFMGPEWRDFMAEKHGTHWKEAFRKKHGFDESIFQYVQDSAKGEYWKWRLGSMNGLKAAARWEKRRIDQMVARSNSCKLTLAKTLANHYTPLAWLTFAAGAPIVSIMSANRTKQIDEENLRIEKLVKNLKKPPTEVELRNLVMAQPSERERHLLYFSIVSRFKTTHFPKLYEQ